MAATPAAATGATVATDTYINRHGDIESRISLGQGDWARRWRNPAWHLAEPHGALKRYITRFTPPSPSKPSPRVLVPLCGATNDLIFLANNGFTAVGIEYVDDAIHRFYEQNAAATRRAHTTQVAPEITRYSADALPIHIFRADIYDSELTADVIGGHCDHIWDRAALVAVNKADRSKYYRKLFSLISLAPPSAAATATTSTTLLQNVFVYPQRLMHGPPFSVGDDELTNILRHIADGTDDSRQNHVMNVESTEVESVPTEPQRLSELRKQIGVGAKHRTIIGEHYGFDIEWLHDETVPEKMNGLYVDRNYSISIRRGQPRSH